MEDKKNCNRCKFGLNYDIDVQIHCMKCLQGIKDGFEMKPENWGAGRTEDRPAIVTAKPSDPVRKMEPKKKAIVIPVYASTICS